MQSSKPKARQRQLRSFVIAWLGVTLLMGALTFVGIYYATGIVNANASDPTDENVAALPNPEVETTPDNDFDPSEIETTPVPQAEQAIQVIEETLDQDAAAADRANTTTDPAASVAASDTAANTANAVANANQAAGQGNDPAAAPVAQDVTPVPSATPIPVSNTAFQVGIQVQPNPKPEEYTMWMNEVRDKLRLGWIKQQVRWEDVEPSPGQYNWTALDVSLALAAEYNTKVMLSVVTAPEWAREPGNQRLDEVGPPADPQTYANFLITMLYRYPGQIHAIEVWNEMNIDREWASIYGLSAENYVTLLRTAYNAVKSVDPGVIVISGALSPTGWNDGVAAYDDFVYMDMLIAAGLLDTTDCVGAHHNGYNIGPNVPVFSGQPAPNDPTATFRGPFDNAHHSWSFYTTLNGYAQRIQQAGSDKKLCITEFGWATTEGLNGTPVGFEFANDNTLAEQAQYFDEAISSMESWGFVWLAWVWNLNYGPQAGWDAANDNVPYSLIRPDWQNAPAYDAIAKYDFRSR
ncbi:MAG: beta-galactosidase [Anaerolineae bacterium]|nr:beta-galactosidase [Anaerolineae bacterium]